MNIERASDYLEFLEQFSTGKQSKKFKRAFASLHNKLTALKKKYPNSLEFDHLKESLRDLREFHDYAYDSIFESMVMVNEIELKASRILDEDEKYAKILGCLGVTPFIYHCLSDESMEFVINNYGQIGELTVGQLVDIDIAYTICITAFKNPPKDYNQLKKTFEFIQTRAENENISPVKSRVRTIVEPTSKKADGRRRRRH